MKNKPLIIPMVFKISGLFVILQTAWIYGILLLTRPEESHAEAWQPWKPVEVSSIDTSLYEVWDDKFDTTYVDSWGIKYVTRK